MNTQESPIPLKRTPLFESHQKLGARFTGFGGWEMPVQYSGLVDEHQAVRTKVGLFDVSHMGEVFVRGKNALQALQYLTSNDVAKLLPGRAQYSLLCNPNGGVVDDIIVYRLKEEEYLLCVNAANTDKDFSWILRNNIHHAELEDASKQFAQIAIQGPKAATLLSLLFPDQSFDLDSFPSFSIRSCGFRSGATVLIARTGYTGEDGFEIFCQANVGAALWESLFQHGAALGVKPAGLGARDTLRLEACYPLHGHELGDTLSALSCGVGWVVKFDKGEFIGREALFKEKNLGVSRQLCGFEVVDPGIVREGAKLFTKEGREVGWISSGTKPPTVAKAVGLGFVPVELAKIGTELCAEVRGKKLRVAVVKTPFYKRERTGR